jgi:hypothetical protein
MPVDLVAAYTETQGRLVELVRSLDAGKLALRVPATPAWRIRDVIAHLTHVAGDYAAGRHRYSALAPDEMALALPGDLVSIDAWTEAGIDERRSRTIDDLVDEWNDATLRLGKMIAGDARQSDPRSNEMLAWAAVSDLATHAQDVRGALGLAPDRAAYATKLAYASFTLMLEARAAGADVPPLRLVTERGVVALGETARSASIDVDWYELLRASSGRRSAAQIAEVFAPVDAGPYLSIISPYPLPVEPLTV